MLSASPTKMLQTKEPINSSFTVAFVVFKNWHSVLPEDGTNVPKHVEEAYLMFLLI